jgi:DNA-binding CsgD family transcriptional regulator
MRAHLDMLEDLLTCTSEAQLRLALNKHVKQLGFDSWVYVASPNGRHTLPYFLSEYPPAWIDHYLEKGYLGIDPVVAHCRAHATPLLWTPDGLVGEGKKRSPAFFHDAADHGLKVGISSPIHGLGCQWGLLSVAGTDQKSDPATKLHQLACVQLLATFAHEAGHHFAVAPGKATVHLTARELECLRWAAEGKTGWEIGRLLGISERTVVFHVENAARKLDVFGRRQAVARAIALNLITL